MMRIVRRITLTALCLCLLWGAALAEGVPGITVNGMLRRSLDMLGSDFMLEMNTLSSLADELGNAREKVRAIAEGDYAAPAHAFLLVNPAGEGDTAEAALLRQTWPFEAAEELHVRNGSNLFSWLFGASGEADISLLMENAGDDRLFACDRPNGCGLLILLYENGTPYVLPWYAENGAVRVRGRFVRNDKLAACDSLEDMEELLASEGMHGLSVTEAPWDAAAGSDRLVLGDGMDSFDAARAQELAKRMAQFAGQLSEQPDLPMDGYAAAPRLIVVGEPSQNLLSFGIALNNLTEPKAVKLYSERFYERQAVEMLARFDLGRAAAADDPIWDLNDAVRVSLICADEAAQGSGAAILLYDDALPVCVYWYAENGAVRMEGWFGDEALGTCRNAMEVTLHLLKTQMGYGSIQFREWQE